MKWQEIRPRRHRGRSPLLDDAFVRAPSAFSEFDALIAAIDGTRKFQAALGRHGGGMGQAGAMSVAMTGAPPRSERRESRRGFRRAMSAPKLAQFGDVREPVG
jgi:hypothetical protein